MLWFITLSDTAAGGKDSKMGKQVYNPLWHAAQWDFTL